MIGVPTEALAEHMGPRIGGPLNATFGNAAEIIIGLVALSNGLPEVVRAFLAGSIIGIPLDLNFSIFEVAMFALVAGLYALISLDGESNW